MTLHTYEEKKIKQISRDYYKLLKEDSLRF